MHSKGQEYTRLNVAEFKMKLVEDLVGKLLTDLFGDSIWRFMPGRRNGTHVCSDPGWPKSQVRVPRTHVAVCGVPLCSMGSGKVKYDCFTEAHKTEDRVNMVLKKHQQMQMKNPNRNSK